jgi:hypothetical protein
MNLKFFIIVILLFSSTFVFCSRNDDDKNSESQKKELEQKEKELELKEKELELKEKELEKPKSTYNDREDIDNEKFEKETKEKTYYESYQNTRLGFRVKYPEDFTQMPKPTNNDGREFISKDGSFTLLVYGSNYIEGLGLDWDYESAFNDFDEVTYKRKKNNWFVLSGYKGNKIVYLKTFYGSGCSNTVYMKYPKRDKAKYDDIVTSIVRSFKPGDLKGFQ